MRELMECRKDGYRAMLCFVIQMKGVHTFAPNWSTQPAFGRALAAAEAAGVRLIAMDCRVAPDHMILDRPVPIDLTPPPGLSL